MNDFNQRWQQAAREAQSVADDLSMEVPFGFTTRVLAGAQQAPAESLEEIFSAFGLRALAVTLAIGLVSAGLVFSEWYDFGIERPKLEQTMTSELSWP